MTLECLSSQAVMISDAITANSLSEALARFSGRSETLTASAESYSIVGNEIDMTIAQRRIV